MSAELPTGTVTLLFTDIEGSTKLLHELGERYAETLAERCGQRSPATAAPTWAQGEAFSVAADPRAVEAHAKRFH